MRELIAKFEREAQEARERAQKMWEEEQRAVAAAKEEANRVKKAEAAKARAEVVARAATGGTRKAIKAQEEAERRLKECIRPAVTPSLEELAAAKRRIQYREDCFHLAVTGIRGSGKSSFVNAIRGLGYRVAGSAPVGIREAILSVARYPDANPESAFVWYDFPGASTIKCRDWQYFNDQGFYVFDCIIVLFSNHFTMTDIAILVNARRFNIPTYIVRSKADQHIRDVMFEMGCDGGEEDDDDEEEDVERRDKVYKAARKQFIEETRKSVQANLEDAKLPDQRVYIVSNSTLLSIVLHKMSTRMINEVDLLNQVYSRRVSQFR